MKLCETVFVAFLGTTAKFGREVSFKILTLSSAMIANGPRGADASKNPPRYSHCALIVYELSRWPEYTRKESTVTEQSEWRQCVFRRQNNGLNVENACEAGRCSLTYSVRCAQSPRLNFTSPNSQARKVSKILRLFLRDSRLTSGNLVSSCTILYMMSRQ